MENKFECGNAVLLRVTVNAVYNEGSVYDYDVSYLNHDTGEEELIPVIEEQLTTASVAPNIDWQAKYNEYNEKAEAKIRELATRLNGMAESLREAQAKAVSLNSTIKNQDAAYADVLSKNILLTEKNDELETTVSELSVLVNNLRKEIAQREEGWDNVSRNNDIAVYNLNRLCKQREVLTDRIIALEAELEAEREKHNG
jgi:predicted Zn-dependent protease